MDEAKKQLAATLAANVRLARRNAGLTQRALAAKAKTTVPTVSRIECGIIADPTVLPRIAAVLGVSEKRLRRARPVSLP